MTIYDVCVIGSGAAGGVVAKELAEGGAKVSMLEAGQEVPPSRFLSHRWPYELPYRGLRGVRRALFTLRTLRRFATKTLTLSEWTASGCSVGGHCTGMPSLCAMHRRIFGSGLWRELKKIGR